MKKVIWYKATGSTKYSHLPKFIFAFVSAHLIITHDGKYSYLDIFTSKFYYSALLITSIIALGFILIAYRITRGLDYFYPWSRNYQKRLRWQLVFGVLLVLCIATVLALIYVELFGVNRSKMVSFLKCFSLSAILLTLLSAFLFYEWSVKNKPKSTPKNALKKAEVEFDQNWATAEIACIFIENKYYFAYSFNDEKIVWKENLSNTIANLPAEDFYMVRNSYIVNRKAIKEVIVVSSRKTKILLVEPIDEEVEISRRENTNFKKWVRKK